MLRIARVSKQRGVALLGLLAVIVMVFAYVLTSRLNAASRFVAVDRGHNATVMMRAKQAVVGYAAQTAFDATERNPGRLPCPEAAGNYGTANEGIAAGNCSVPAVGRLPWRTLGIEKLVDSSGEPLWYVVSSGWAPPTSTSTLVINPDTLGQLTVDGAANNAAALIIAPGPAIVVQGGSGCTARSQLRNPSAALDKRDYLECGNDVNAFVTSAPGKTFNDQVVRLVPAEIMPALEAAIQQRAQREIAPALRDAAFALDSNSPRRWVSSTSNPPIYPYPVPFTNPTTSVSNYRGASGTDQGLMPFAPVAGFVSYASVPANATKTTSAGTLVSQTCYWESATVYTCEGVYREDSGDPTLPITLRMEATFTNVAMGFRTFNTSALTAHARDDNGSSTWSTASVSTTRRLEMNDGSVGGKPHGSVTARLTVTVPNINAMGWGTTAEFRLRVDRAVIADHCLLSTTVGTNCAGNDTSWFVRNEWYRNVYYAVASQNTPTVLPNVGGCTKAGNNCLRFIDDNITNPPSPTSADTDRNIRVLLILAGRRLGTQTRPSSSLADYLEFQNNDLGTVYEQRTMRNTRVAMSPPTFTIYAPWNDRAVLVDGFSTPKYPSFPATPVPIAVQW